MNDYEINRQHLVFLSIGCQQRETTHRRKSWRLHHSSACAALPPLRNAFRNALSLVRVSLMLMLGSICALSTRAISSEARLDASTVDVVNAYNQFALPQFWGSGQHVSADGTKWDVYEQNLLAEYHIRYGGWGGNGIDAISGFSQQVVPVHAVVVLGMPNYGLNRCAQRHEEMLETREPLRLGSSRVVADV